LTYETKNGLPTNPEAIVLTPPPSAPVLPPSIEYFKADEPSDQPPEGTEERSTKVKAERKIELKIRGTFEDVLQKVHDLIGLRSVKYEVEQTVDEIKYHKLLAQQGEKPVTMSRHMVFTGNPGTGKTTIARYLGEIYMHLGVLSKGHMVETDRAGLVAGYLGQTALRTDQVISSALGGVLFIDEAYALTSEDRDQFGQEAIDTLLKRMEDNRDNLIVIVAGYPEEMERFINANPGLQSRFTKYIHFDDYSASELMQIFELLLKSSGHNMSSKSSNHLGDIFEEMDRLRDQKFGNGRTVRNLYEKTIRNVATRVIRTMPKNIKMVLPEDISIQDVHAVLRIAPSVATSASTSEGIEDEVAEADYTVDSSRFIGENPCEFYENLGRSMHAFVNQQQDVSVSELTGKLDYFISGRIGHGEQFLPVINECALLISQFDGHLSLSNQYAWEQFIKHRIQQVFSQQSIEIANSLLRGYLNAKFPT
jgi:SpoVK/Ycf46/Vps4 family AAA+-type ATPase